MENSNIEGMVNSVRDKVLQIDTKKDFVIYTTFFGIHGNRSINIPTKSAFYDFILFTDDDNLHLGDDSVFQITTREKLRNARITAKIFKILPHIFLSRYRYSLYIDANVSLISNPDLFVRLLLESGKGILFFKHNKRDCIYEEGRACIKIMKDDPNIVLDRIKYYRSKGYPANNGLIQGGLIFRDHTNSDVNRIMEMWWDEIEKYSERDQLSFNYVAWREGFKIEYLDIEGTLHNSNYTRVVSHKLLEYNRNGTIKRHPKIFMYNLYFLLRKLFS